MFSLFGWDDDGMVFTLISEIEVSKLFIFLLIFGVGAVFGFGCLGIGIAFEVGGIPDAEVLDGFEVEVMVLPGFFEDGLFFGIELGED